jgi:hypothetical protein
LRHSSGKIGHHLPVCFHIRYRKPFFTSQENISACRRQYTANQVQRSIRPGPHVGAAQQGEADKAAQLEPGGRNQGQLSAETLKL